MTDRATLSKPGNASIEKLGQTTTGQYGDNPDAMALGRRKPRDLTIKSGS